MLEVVETTPYIQYASEIRLTSLGIWHLASLEEDALIAISSFTTIKVSISSPTRQSSSVAAIPGRHSFK
jgi:hypothetical protein